LSQLESFIKANVNKKINVKEIKAKALTLGIAKKYLKIILQNDRWKTLFRGKKHQRLEIFTNVDTQFSKVAWLRLR